MSTFKKPLFAGPPPAEMCPAPPASGWHQVHGETKLQAGQLVQAELKRLGWRESDLAARPKGDGEKLKLAVRLRAETTMTVKWIAERLRMGTWTHLNHLLYWHRRETTR